MQDIIAYANALIKGNFTSSFHLNTLNFILLPDCFWLEFHVPHQIAR
jgi:hypothetical protein